ncbi:MAG: hypothetical protein KGL59_13170 [Acidobacteriota bacterium]|nr:hypothetical protein [Acidobacteriota bacterium]
METVTDGDDEPPDELDDGELPPPLLQPVIATETAIRHAVNTAANFASNPEWIRADRPEAIMVSSRESGLAGPGRSSQHDIDALDS